MARRVGIRKMSFGRAAEIVAAQRKNREDVYRSLRELSITLGDPLGPPYRRYRVTVPAENGDYGCWLTPTSLRQLAGISGVPAAFFEHTAAVLGLPVLRGMLAVAAEKDERAYLLRLRRRGRSWILRAIQPPSFARFDDLDIIKESARWLDREEIRIVDLTVTEDLFSLRALFTGQSMPLGKSDSGLAGVDIISSETGIHATQVRQVLVRLVCVNGLTATVAGESSMAAVHTRVSRDDFPPLFKRALESAMDQGRAIAGRLQESRSDFVSDPVAELERVFRDHRLGSLRGRLGRLVVGEALRSETLFGVSRFDLVQTVTAAARGLTPQNRRRVEDAALSFLSDPPGTPGQSTA